MGGCQNYGPFLGTLNIGCRIIIGIQKGTIILTTSYVGCKVVGLKIAGSCAERLGFATQSGGDDHTTSRTKTNFPGATILTSFGGRQAHAGYPKS